MANIRVMVSGSGFMGREVLRGVLGEADMEPVGVIEKAVEILVLIVQK